MQLPSARNPMPLLADVRACVARCRECERCAEVSVSSRRRMCLWYAPLEPHERLHRLLAVASETSDGLFPGEETLQTAWDRDGWMAEAKAGRGSSSGRPPPSVGGVSSFKTPSMERLDDFVTVRVRGLP